MKMRYRLRFICVVIFCIGISTIIYLSIPQKGSNQMFDEPPGIFMVDESDLEDAKLKLTSNIRRLREDYFETANLACRYPVLEIDNPEIWKHLSPVKTSKPDCEREENWTYVENGTFRLSVNAIKKHGDIKCGYQPILRPSSDFAPRQGVRIFPFEDKTLLVSNFFSVDCLAKDGASYSNVHMGIKSTQTPMVKSHLGYNVLMFGFDSVSRMTFMRFLPKTYSFLIKELGAIVMKGYNIVGDGTPAALFPILTGQTERELPESRRGYANAQTVDSFPWIWKQFKNNGYVVQWAEDMQHVGTFQYRLKGFRDPPVDYYGRPFYLFVESKSIPKPLCFGSITRLQGMFDWIRALFEMYSYQPKFSYLFHSHYSHDSNNRLPYADDELFSFLKMMHKTGYLDHTMLIIMTDHGARFSSLRKTHQGKLEERLPFMSIRMPPKFQAQYPTIMRNLRLNSHRLTTPFDIHETFEHLFEFHSSAPYQSKSNRSFSLFELVPENRTCEQSHVAQHWCACQDWRELSVNDSIIQQYSQAVIDFLNNFVSDHKQECATLSLHQIHKAGQLNMNNKRTEISNAQNSMLSSMKETSFYQIQLETVPGNAQFEITAEYDPNKNQFDIQKRYLSRMNKYGDTSACIAQKRPEFREICYCSHLLLGTNVSTTITDMNNRTKH